MSGTRTVVTRDGSRHFRRFTVVWCWERLARTAVHSPAGDDIETVRSIVSCWCAGWNRPIAARVFRQNMRRTLSTGYAEIRGYRAINCGHFFPSRRPGELLGHPLPPALPHRPRGVGLLQQPAERAGQFGGPVGGDEPAVHAVGHQLPYGG